MEKCELVKVLVTEHGIPVTIVIRGVETGKQFEITPTMLYGLVLSGRLEGYTLDNMDSIVSDAFNRKLIEYISGTQIIKKEILDLTSDISRWSKTRSELTKAYNLCRAADYDIVTISGVRRAGKTVLAKQLLCRLANEGYKVIYLLITEDIDFNTLWSFLNTDEIKQYDYICIDEITRCRDLVNKGAVLSDVYANSDRKLILTGTDSYVFALTRKDKWYGRTMDVNLTLLSYADYFNIKGLSVQDYCKSANMIENCDGQHIATAVNAAIISNIVSSLHRNVGLVSELDVLSESDLCYYVLQCLLSRVSHGVKERTFNGVNIDIEDIQRKRQIKAQAKEQTILSIIRADSVPKFNPRIGNLVMNALCDLGVFCIIEEVDENYKSTYINCLMIPGVYSALISVYNMFLCRLSSKEYDMSMLNNDILGLSYENIIRANIIKAYQGYRLCMYRDSQQREVDIVVYDDSSLCVWLYEVKSSTSADSSFLRHIRNMDIQNILTLGGKYSIKQEAVLYNGKSQGNYINIGDFLLNLNKYLG